MTAPASITAATAPKARVAETNGNIVSSFVERATQHPGRAALVLPTEWNHNAVTAVEQLSYAQLAARTSAWQRRLAGAGLEPGHRVLVLVPASTELYACALATIASGMTVVLVDAGMSVARTRAAIDAASPDAMVGGTRARRLARMVPELRRIGCVMPTESPTATTAELTGAEGLPAVVDRRPNDGAIVSFTSGSTGRPKGADRTHGDLLAQHESLMAAFPYRPGDVDMTAWPVLVLHDLLSGTKSVLPPVRRGALRAVPGDATLGFAIEQGVTLLNGPPAFLAPILDAAKRRYAVPALRRVVTGGGPVYPDLCRSVIATFPRARGHVLYGGTEAEPIAHCPMQELIDADDTGSCGAGAGLLVGPAVPDIELAVIETGTPADTDGPAAGSIDDVTVTAGRWGEIAVHGAHVLSRWFDDPKADRATRLRAGDGGERREFLRTGDIGRVDESGRLWLGGRVADIVEHEGRALHPYEVEPVLDRLAGVRRCALMSSPTGGAEVFLDVNPEPGADEAVRLARAALRGMGLRGVAVHWPVAIPVDGRHNSKVDRPRLRARRARIVAAAAARRHLGSLRRRAGGRPKATVAGAGDPVSPDTQAGQDD